MDWRESVGVRMYSYDDNNGDMHGEASHTEELCLMYWSRACFISVNFKLYVNFIE